LQPREWPPRRSTLAGNLTWSENEPKPHAHVVLGIRDGRARGSHLLKGLVRPTLELTLIGSPKHLERIFDPASNQPLVALG